MPPESWDHPNVYAGLRSGVSQQNYLENLFAPEPQKIYVGNLSFQTTEADLTNMFGELGKVESVQIITDRDTGRSKGFGFVQMSDEEAAQKAIERFNGKEFNGRALTVNEARPMERRDSGSRGDRQDRGGRGGGGRGRY